MLKRLKLRELITVHNRETHRSKTCHELADTYDLQMDDWGYINPGTGCIPCGQLFFTEPALVKNWKTLEDFLLNTVHNRESCTGRWFQTRIHTSCQWTIGAIWTPERVTHALWATFSWSLLFLGLESSPDFLLEIQKVSQGGRRRAANTQNWEYLHICNANISFCNGSQLFFQKKV